jgi:hypothetical protein
MILVISIRSIITMLSRRHVEPPVAKRSMKREMRELFVKLDTMKTTQMISPDVGDVSDAENEEVEVE